jgi:hypothetical protein
MKMIPVQRPALAFACAFALLASGCATKTNVARLLADPHRHANHEVTLQGDVVESTSLLGNGAYKLDDGTGSIWVVSTHGVPRRGARVSVNGRVKDVGDVGSLFKLPEQIASGLVMVEDHHKAH